jgi:hypothetical protein
MARLLLALTTVASVSLIAPHASAMTCATNDDVIPPEVGDAVCTVVLTAVSPICHKFQCG